MGKSRYADDIPCLDAVLLLKLFPPFPPDFAAMEVVRGGGAMGRDSHVLGREGIHNGVRDAPLGVERLD